VDLLAHYGLLIECRHNRLLDGVTSLSTPGLIAPPSVPTVKVMAGSPPSRQPPRGVPGAAQTYRDTSRDAAQHHAQHSYNTRPASSLPPAPSCPMTAWPQLRPSSTPCCRTVQQDALRDHSRPPSISCPRRTTVGDPVETTEHSTLALYLTGSQFHVYKINPNASQAAPSFQKLIS